MNIQVFCPRWGSEDLSWEDFLLKVKDAGYDGVEWAIDRNVTIAALEKVWNLAERNNIKIIAQHYDTIEADFGRHFLNYANWLEKIKHFRPGKINSQTGKDFFTFNQNKILIELADTFGVIHETHRGKFSFAAHVMKEYFERMPALRITLDASHWVCVSESFLEDQAEVMNLAIDRTDHIHARVGYAEGPQVADPRSPEWTEALNRHLSWWDSVVERKRTLNEELTITSEFGPFPYMVHVPATGQPVSNQWEVNAWMMNLLKKRYA